MRDEFNEKTKRVIQDRAGNQCSNPDCRTLTSGPNAHPERSTKTGVAAHITAASSGGPRYDPNLSSEQRKSAENGIWLCQRCAHFVDTDSLNYPIDLLYKWRHQAEKEADDETKGRTKGRSSPAASELEMEGWICPHCGTSVEDGKHVCLGCYAEVIYGLTRNERIEASKIGMMIGGVLAFLLFVFLPDNLNSLFGWDLGWGFGLGVFVIIPAGLIVFAGLVVAVHLSEKRWLRQPPRFVRASIK